MGNTVTLLCLAIEIKVYGFHLFFIRSEHQASSKISYKQLDSNRV